MSEASKVASDLEAHVKKGPSAHGILDAVRALLERKVWLSARSSLGLTTQANYTDKDVSASVSSRAKSIIVNVVPATAGGRWYSLSARPNGSAADPLVYYGFEIHDGSNAICHESAWGALIEIPLSYSDKIFEYKLSIDGDWTFYLVAYIEGMS